MDLLELTSLLLFEAQKVANLPAGRQETLDFVRIAIVYMAVGVLTIMIHSNPDMLSRGSHPAYLNFGVPVAVYIFLYIYSHNFTACIQQPSFCNRNGCKPLPLCTKY